MTRTPTDGGKAELVEKLTGYFTKATGLYHNSNSAKKEQEKSDSPSKVADQPNPVLPPSPAKETSSEHKEASQSPEREVDGELVFQGQGKRRKVWVPEIGLVENFMPSDDLNVVVESLLHKRAKMTDSMSCNDSNDS